MSGKFIVVNRVGDGPVGIPVSRIIEFAPDADNDDPRTGHTYIETEEYEYTVKEPFLKVAQYIAEATS